MASEEDGKSPAEIWQTIAQERAESMDTEALNLAAEQKSKGRRLWRWIIALVAVSLVGWFIYRNFFRRETVTPAPPPQSSPTVAEREAEFQQESSESQKRTQVRQAAIDFVKSKAPDWTVKGVSALPDGETGSYFVYIDLQKDNRSVIMPFHVVKFFPESGDPYWRVIFYASEVQGARRDADLLQQLKDELQ